MRCAGLARFGPIASPVPYPKMVKGLVQIAGRGPGEESHARVSSGLRAAQEGFTSFLRPGSCRIMRGGGQSARSRPLPSPVGLSHSGRSAESLAYRRAPDRSRWVPSLDSRAGPSEGSSEGDRT